MDAVIPLVVGSLETNRLAPRGRLVRVRCGTHQTAPEERWFAVGIYLQKLAEAPQRVYSIRVGGQRWEPRRP